MHFFSGAPSGQTSPAPGDLPKRVVGQGMLDVDAFAVSPGHWHQRARWGKKWEIRGLYSSASVGARKSSGVRVRCQVGSRYRGARLGQLRGEGLGRGSCLVFGTSFCLRCPNSASGHFEIAENGKVQLPQNRSSSHPNIGVSRYAFILKFSYSGARLSRRLLTVPVPKIQLALHHSIFPRTPSSSSSNSSLGWGARGRLLATMDGFLKPWCCL